MTRATLDLLVFGLIWAAKLPYSAAWLLLAASLLLWFRGESWRHFGLARPTRRMVWTGLAVGAGFQVFSLYVLEPWMARWFTGRPPDVSIFRGMIGEERELAKWLLISWTLAAFGEEMTYRGWLMTRAAQILGQGRVAWGVALSASALLFGMAHAYQGPPGILVAGITGAVLGALYMSSGRNLWPVVLAHGVADTIACVMIYLGVYPGL